MLNPQLGRRPLDIPNSQVPSVLVIPVHLPANLLQLLGGRPHALPVAQPQPQHVPLAVGRVREAAARVQHGEVVEDLNVALLEDELDRVLLGEEVDRVEGLGLEFAHGGHGRVVRREVGARQGAARELEAGAGAGGGTRWRRRGEVVEQGAAVVLAVPESEFLEVLLAMTLLIRGTQEKKRDEPGDKTYSSKIQSSLAST